MLLAFLGRDALKPLVLLDDLGLPFGCDTHLIKQTFMQSAS
jgi:hypothetical protein